MMTVFQENSATESEKSEIMTDSCFDGVEQQKKKIVFVCTGNTCRSPMAEIVFNFDYCDSGYVAESAGLAADGAPMSENALDALFDEGYRVKGQHLSRPLSKDVIESADIIVGISSSHAMQIVMANPEYAAKVYCMPFDIADPYGRSLEVYKACLWDIKKALAIIAESL